MQSTIYVEMAPGVRTEDLHRQLKLSYQVKIFVSACHLLTIHVITTTLQKCNV